jgi:predicted DNA-binding transcriptional regulator AlpA
LKHSTYPRILDLAMIARESGASVSAVRTWHARGQLPPGTKLTGVWIWQGPEIEAFIQAKRNRKETT